ncbi:MAG TPA: pilin [Candidatus Saccharimonadales bacterium]|nr:pilin [Candidatus Saccharimonadales bacterium]
MIKKFLISTALAFSLFLPMAPLVSAQGVTNQIQNGLCSGSNLQISTNPTVSSCDTGPSGGDTLSSILRHFINILSAIVGVVAVIMIIFGGFRYITSGGNDTSITSAKNTILYAIIGLIIVALAQILVHFVLNNLVGV